MAALNSSRGGGERQHQGQREHQRNQLLHGVIPACHVPLFHSDRDQKVAEIGLRGDCAVGFILII